MLVFMKGNSFDQENETVWSKILMSANLHMDQRGDHSMHVVPPLVLTKIQKLKNLFFHVCNCYCKCYLSLAHTSRHFKVLTYHADNGNPPSHLQNKRVIIINP